MEFLPQYEKIYPTFLQMLFEQLYSTRRKKERKPIDNKRKVKKYNNGFPKFSSDIDVYPSICDNTVPTTIIQSIIIEEHFCNIFHFATLNPIKPHKHPRAIRATFNACIDFRP